MDAPSASFYPHERHEAANDVSKVAALLLERSYEGAEHYVRVKDAGVGGARRPRCSRILARARGVFFTFSSSRVLLATRLLRWAVGPVGT